MSEKNDPKQLPDLMAGRGNQRELSSDTGSRRRRADDYSVGRRYSRRVNIAIFASFLFSAGLTVWSFSRPFTSGGFGVGDKQAEIESSTISRRWEATLSNEQYVDYAMEMDRDLLDRVYRKYHQRKRIPTDYERKQKWENSLRRKEKLIERLIEENGGEPLTRGTVEWEFQQYLEKVAQDSPGTEQ